MFSVASSFITYTASHVCDITYHKQLWLSLGRPEIVRSASLSPARAPVRARAEPAPQILTGGHFYIILYLFHLNIIYSLSKNYFVIRIIIYSILILWYHECKNYSNFVTSSFCTLVIIKSY